MQFSTISTLLFTTFVAAGHYSPCTGNIQSNPLCCSTFIASAASLDCGNVYETPANAQHFSDICTNIGKQALCCGVPVAGQALICVKPISIQD